MPIESSCGPGGESGGRRLEVGWGRAVPNWPMYGTNVLIVHAVGRTGQNWGYGRVNWDQASMWIRESQKLQRQRKETGRASYYLLDWQLVMLVVYVLDITM